MDSRQSHTATATAATEKMVRKAIAFFWGIPWNYQEHELQELKSKRVSPNGGKFHSMATEVGLSAILASIDQGDFASALEWFAGAAPCMLAGGFAGVRNVRKRSTKDRGSSCHCKKLQALRKRSSEKRLRLVVLLRRLRLRLSVSQLLVYTLR